MLKKSILIIFVIGTLGAILFTFQNCDNNEFSRRDETGDKKGTDGTCLDSLCENYQIVRTISNPEQRKKVNVLFVFDNSDSMDENNAKLSDKMSNFLDKMDENLIDYNLCYTLSEQSVFSTGRVSRWVNNERVLTNSTVDVDRVFIETLDSIQGNNAQTANEQPIAATNNMISSNKNGDCFKAGTHLDVVVLTDEDENGCIQQGCIDTLPAVNHPNTLVDLAKNNIGAGNFQVHAIIAAEDNPACYTTTNNDINRVVAELSRLTGTGDSIGDLCAPNYDTELTKVFEVLSNNLVKFDVKPLECDPKDLTATLVSSGQKLNTEIRNNLVYFIPGIPEGQSAELKYNCVESF